MTNNQDRYVNDLKARGWQIQANTLPRKLPEMILERQFLLPEKYVDFLTAVSFMVNKNYTAWFLMIDDFNGTSDRAFRWNEFEIMSLEWGADDADTVDKVTKFWQKHLPIAFSVKSGYAYLALSLDPTTYGSVVYGREPTFENGWVVMDNFIGILELLSMESTDATPIYILDFQ